MSGSTKKLCDNGSVFLGGGCGIGTLAVSTRCWEITFLPNDLILSAPTNVTLNGRELIVNEPVFCKMPCEKIVFLALVNVVPSEFVGLSVILNSRGPV